MSDEDIKKYLGNNGYTYIGTINNKVIFKCAEHGQIEIHQKQFRKKIKNKMMPCIKCLPRNDLKNNLLKYSINDSVSE